MSPIEISNAIGAYEEMKKVDAKVDAYVEKGGQLTAPYSYLTYLLHVAIAFATGFVASLFIGTGLGVICGIVSFIISFIVHWAKKSRNLRYTIGTYRTSIIKRIVLYTVITVAIVIAIKTIF